MQVTSHEPGSLLFLSCSFLATSSPVPSLFSIPLGWWSQLQVQPVMCIKLTLKLWKEGSSQRCVWELRLLQSVHRMGLVQLMATFPERKVLWMFPRVPISTPPGLRLVHLRWSGLPGIRITVRLAPRDVTFIVEDKRFIFSSFKVLSLYWYLLLKFIIIVFICLHLLPWKLFHKFILQHT